MNSSWSKHHTARRQNSSFVTVVVIEAAFGASVQFDTHQCASECMLESSLRADGIALRASGSYPVVRIGLLGMLGFSCMSRGFRGNSPNVIFPGKFSFCTRLVLFYAH